MFFGSVLKVISAEATGAADVEPEDLNAEVLFLGDLFARVEFSTLVDVFTTGCAFHRKRSPQGARSEEQSYQSCGFVLLPVDPILADSIYSKPSSPT
jgi:hypothetical protein